MGGIRLYSYSSSASASYWFAYALGSLAVCIILGFVTKHINENKGYSGGFAWGFWLNLIGVIVVACKPDNRQYSQPHVETALEKEAKERKIIADGGWKCTCGRTNYNYVSTCACGKNKREVLYAKKEESKPTESASSSKNNETVALIKQLADLHSQGILSDEEFETKKAELLAKM